MHLCLDRLNQWLRRTGNATLNPEDIGDIRICTHHFPVRYRLVRGKGFGLTDDAIPDDFDEQNLSILDNNPVVNDNDHPNSIPAITLNNDVLQPSGNTPAEQNIVVGPPINSTATNGNRRGLQNAGDLNLHRQWRRRRQVQQRQQPSNLNHLEALIRENRQLKNENKVLNKTIKNLKQKVRRYITYRNRAERTLSKDKIMINIRRFVDHEKLLLFIRMQLDHFGHKNMHWTEAEKKFAYGIYYKSPAGYVFLLTKCGFVLPSVSTIRRGVNKMPLFPGVHNEEYKKHLKMKVNSMEQQYFEPECILMWDEMSLKPGLFYNEKLDLVEGVQDYGKSDHRIERTSDIANTALVFILTGLSFKWKQPLSYYLSFGPVKYNILKELILENLSAALDCGFKVRVLTCDQSQTNQSTVTDLGITDRKTYILAENGEKIFFIYDWCHLIKCLRNNLMEHDFFIGKTRVSWGAIREIREVERNKVARSCPKLRDVHINPNKFEKMKPIYAMQVFSNSVYAGLMTGHATGDLKNPHAVGTAHYCKKINDVNDVLNARSCRDSNPKKRGLTVYHPENEQLLRDLLREIPTWRMANNRVPDCFCNLELSLISLLDFWDVLKADRREYILTAKLLQDVLENIFSVYRNRCGSNCNPTSDVFRRNFQYSCMVTLLSSNSANCLPDDDHILMESADPNLLSDNEDEDGNDVVNWDSLDRIRQWYNEMNIFNDFIRGDDPDEFNPEDPIDFVYLNPDHQPGPEPENEAQNNSIEITLLNNTKKFVAGYLAYLCDKKFSCSLCKQYLFSDNPENVFDGNDLLIFFKDFNVVGAENLRIPSEKFFDVILSIFNVFETLFPSKYHINNVSQIFKDLMLAKISQKYASHFSENCTEHRDFIITRFVLLILRYSIRWFNNDHKDRSNRRRLNILTEAR